MREALIGDIACHEYSWLMPSISLPTLDAMESCNKILWGFQQRQYCRFSRPLFRRCPLWSADLVGSQPWDTHYCRCNSFTLLIQEPFSDRHCGNTFFWKAIVMHCCGQNCWEISIRCEHPVEKNRVWERRSFSNECLLRAFVLKIVCSFRNAMCRDSNSSSDQTWWVGYAGNRAKHVPYCETESHLSDNLLWFFSKIEGL